MFGEDAAFNRKAKVDKYGRRLKAGPTKEQERLRKLYKADEEESEEEEEEVAVKERWKGEKKKGGRKIASASSSSEEESDVPDEDEAVQRELRRVAGYDPARGGGFSSSSDESSSDEEVEAEEEEDVAEEEQQARNVPMGEVSSRLAIVNLDWDNVRAMDILAVASSFVPPDGRIENVTIYPSEFGKERLEREELEGPPKEVFAASKARSKGREQASDEDSEDDEAIRKKLQSGDNEEEFDSAALRQYQLDRLRYFYAVLTCSSSAVAQSIYTALDGREYLSTANFFDLRFIPDGVSFDDDKPREQITSLPQGYKPNEFVTEALTHSKVKLTWDADDATRKEVQKRAFSRKDVDENDMRAYIGGDSDSEEEEEVAEGEDGKVSKKDAERAKMRELLGLASEKREKGVKVDRPVGDMQITFTAGLSGREGRGGVFENSPPRDETTRERYVRKEKERKTKRKEKMKAKRDGTELPGEANGEEDDSGSEIGHVEATADGAARPADDDGKDPFDDPFFNDPVVETKSKKERIRKEDRIKKREEREAQEKKDAAARQELELLMDADKDRLQHFDMKEIKKAAKKKGKKDKRGKVDADGEGGVQLDDGGAAVETRDPRFAKLYDSHEYAIDPTNPRFQKTEGMKRLLEEGRKRRRDGAEDDDAGDVAAAEKKTKKVKAVDGGDDTQKLLARVKARSKASSRG